MRTLCGVLYTTGCRVSDALALTPKRIDLAGRAVVFETLKKRRQGVYKAVPVPPGPWTWTSSTWCTASGRPSGAAKAMPTGPWSARTASPKGLRQETMSARTACGLPARHRRS